MIIVTLKQKLLLLNQLNSLVITGNEKSRYIQLPFPVNTGQNHWLKIKVTLNQVRVKQNEKCNIDKTTNKKT